jgi:N4-gp56 family major capsid protein
MGLGVNFTVNHTLARKLWSMDLERVTPKESWWHKNGFVGTDKLTNPIFEQEDLKRTAGYTIRYGLRDPMRGKFVAGDNQLEGKEGSLDFLSDDVSINQARNGLKSRGKFSEKVVPYNIRAELRDAQKDYWAVFEDEQIFGKLSGELGKGIWETIDTTASGRDVDGAIDFDGNTLRAPSTNRKVIANGKAKNTLVATDKFTLTDVDTALKIAGRLQGNATTKRRMKPLRIGGKNVWVCVMDIIHAFDLKADTAGRWYDIEKARLQGGFKESALIQNSLGVYESAAGCVVFYSAEGVVKFDDFGAGGNIKAARALLMGQMAGTIAYGSEEGAQRFSWHEETDDRGNQLVVDTGLVIGVQKCSYETTPGGSTREDYGVITIDAAAAW